MNEQATNQRRVSDKIGPIIVDFCRERIATGVRTFYMTQLLEYVRSREPSVAPDSPGRILRQLRGNGTVTVALLSRSGSQYEVSSVRS